MYFLHSESLFQTLYSNIVDFEDARKALSWKENRFPSIYLRWQELACAPFAHHNLNMM